MTNNKKKTKNGTDIPPFPRLGEIYRVLALALDTKRTSLDFKGLYRDIDRLAREGEYDWSLLPKLCHHLITNPLKSYTDADFAQQIEQFAGHVHKNYLHLVATVSLDSLSREEALPLLIENYFSWYGCNLLLSIKKVFGGPEIISLLDAEMNPIKAVLDWASNSSTDLAGKSLVKIAFPDATEDKTKRDKANRWVVGKQLPEMGNVKSFVDALKAKGFIQHENLRRWLVVARALAWLEKKSPGLHNIMRQHLQQGLQMIDI